MPTAVEMKWLGNTTGFSANNAYGVVTAVRDARIPRQSVSAVIINWGDKPASHMDSWEFQSATSQRSVGSGNAPVGLNSSQSRQLSGILASLKPYMSVHGRISVSGLTVKPQEAVHFSNIAGVPVSFTSSAAKDDWPGTGGTVKDNWPGAGGTAQDDWAL